MRERKPIPETHTQWLNDYLARKGLSGYPDELTANQWRLLQGAYRQVLLKERKPLNNALINDSKEAKLLSENKRLKDKLSRLEQTSLITPPDKDSLTHSEILKLKSQLSKALKENNQLNEDAIFSAKERDNLIDDNDKLRRLLNQSKKELKSIKSANDRGVKAVAGGKKKEVSVYDNAALNADIAQFIGCSIKSNTKVSGAKTTAKSKLGYSTRAGAKMTSEQNRAIIEWLKVNDETL